MKLEEILKSKKVRITKFRLDVLDIISSQPHALSVDQIEQELSTFDRTTLYRTIKTFKEKGVLHEIKTEGDKKLALCDSSCHYEHHHDHVHFHCIKCKEVFCLNSEPIPKLDIDGFRIDSLDLHAKGICIKCS